MLLIRKPLLTIALFGILAAPLRAEMPYDAHAGGVYYMADLETGAVLFSYDADKRILPASMTKMMTVYVAFDLIKQNKLFLDDHFVMPDELWRQWSNQGSTMFIKSGQSVSVADLLHGIITLSGNDASALLAHGISGSEAGFTTLMNEKARELGLKGSHFANAKGWPDGGKTYSTARDLGTIAERTLADFPDLYRQFYATSSFRFNGVEQANRNPILGLVKGADGLKTGHTEEAGYGFTGSAQQGGRRLIMVIGGMPTNAMRADQSVQFLNWGFANTSSKALFKAKTIIGKAKVQGGTESSVNLMVARNTGIAFVNGMKNDVTLMIRYKGPLRAPIEKGAHIADLVTVYSDGSSQATPLYAEHSIPKGNFIHRIRDGIMGLFS